jgi:hypothetical protein
LRSFVVAFLVGVAALAVLGLVKGSDLVYSPGVTPQAPVVPVAAGQVACQGPIHVPDGAKFDRVAFTVGTYFKPGPPLRVTIVDQGGATIGHGELPGGYPDIADAPEHVVRVGRVQTTDPVQVCIENKGPGQIAFYGQAGVASPRSAATVDGTPSAYDIALTLRREQRSLLALLPTMADRAALFRAGWVTPIVYLILALALLIGAPLVLARALGRAADEDRGLRESAGRSMSRQDPSASP